MFAEDLDLFLREFGVDCSYEGQPFRAIFDRPSDTLTYGDPGARSTAYQITLRTDVGQQIGLLDADGDAIDGLIVAVAGVSYRTRAGGTIADGAFAGIDLSLSRK